MYCMLLSNWNKLCKRFHLNPTNLVARENNSGLWRWTRWRDLGWDIHGKELIIFVVRDLTDSLLCVFSRSNNRTLLMLVSRSMTSEYGVFIPFSNNLFFAPALRWITFPCCFSRPKSPKGWSTWCKLFRLFFFLWCWYCVSFPWVSEVEIEIAVTKTNCMYTACSRVVKETSSSWLAIISF